MRTHTITWSPGEGWSADPATIDSRPGSTMALAFADPLVDISHALTRLCEALPGTTVVACSTAGQILGARVDPAPLVVAITAFDSARVIFAFAPTAPTDGRELGMGLGRRLVTQAGEATIAGVLVLAGGLNINGSALVDGLTSSLPAGIALSGGLAADGARFKNTWVHCEGQTSEAGAVAIAVLGDNVSFHHGSRGGWDGFGPQRKITHSDHNVLYELDGQPALGLYKQYLGDLATELPSSALLFPLTVSAPDSSTHLVRTVLTIDEQAQSMTFAGDVPEDWSARLMWTTMEGLMEGAGDAAEEAVQENAGLAVAISCVGRRLVLGDRTDEELEAVADALGADVPIIGFYSYGEIAPQDGLCSLHNQTMTVTTIREDVVAS